jgi:hypothetical protein
MQRASDACFFEAFGAVDVLVSEAAPVAQEISIDAWIISVLYAPNRAVALSGKGVAAEAAVRTDGRSRREVPLARGVAFECFICEGACGADLGEVSAKRAFQYTVFMAAEEEVVMPAEDIEVPAAGIISVEAYASVAVDAPIHLLVDEGTEILIFECSLWEAVSTAGMPCHHGHILQVAFSSLIANGAVVRVVCHEPFDDVGAEGGCLRIIDRGSKAVADGCDARHGEASLRVVFVFEEHDGALAAGSCGAKGGVPAKIREVELKGETGFEEILSRIFDAVWRIVDSNRDHCHGHLFC